MSNKYFKIGLIAAACAGSLMIANVSSANNVGRLTVTANSDYVVNIQDHSQDFSVNLDNYASHDAPDYTPFSIWTNSPETVTVSVASGNGLDDASTAYLIHTAPGATLDVHEQIPYRILYKPCNTGSAIEVGGNASFNLNYDQANKAVCEQSEGAIRVVRLPITDASTGAAVLPAAGSYQSAVTLTVQQPTGGGSVLIQ